MSKLTIENIRHAAEVLREVARKTDMIFAPKLSTNAQVWLKTENLQVTGSFKVRGAYYKISKLTDRELARGVIACSAGNHAQGVALGAQRRGARAVICMPDIAPIAKIEATKSYGAEVHLVPGTYDDASAYAAKLCKEEGMTFVHPFDDPDVIAGQGTVGLEILEQLPDVDAVLVPIGGGGLISGVAYAIKHLKPTCKVYGVQAAEAPSMKRCALPHRAAQAGLRGRGRGLGGGDDLRQGAGAARQEGVLPAFGWQHRREHPQPCDLSRFAGQRAAGEHQAVVA